MWGVVSGGGVWRREGGAPGAACVWGVVPGGGVWRQEGGAPGSSPCLSLALPESGLGCRGNIEALIFLACVLAPGFPFLIFHFQSRFPGWGQGFQAQLGLLCVYTHLLHSWA